MAAGLPPAPCVIREVLGSFSLCATGSAHPWGVEAGACWPPRPRLRDRGNPGGAAHSLRCAEPAWPIERAALEPVSKPTVPGAQLHGAAGEALGPGAWRQLPQPPSSPPLERADESREGELGRGPPPETTYLNTRWQSRLWLPPHPPAHFSFFWHLDLGMWSVEVCAGRGGGLHVK